MLSARRGLDLDIGRLVFHLELLELLMLLVLLLITDGGRGSQVHATGHTCVRVVRVDHLVAALAIKWLLIGLLNIVMLMVLFLPTLQTPRILLLSMISHGPTPTHIQTCTRMLPQFLAICCIGCLSSVYFSAICLALVLLDHAGRGRIG